MSDSTTKQCSKCKRILHATTVFFPPNQKRPDGLQSWCRNCFRERQRKVRSTPEYKEKRRAYLSKPATKALERTRRSTAAAREKHRIYQQQYRTRPEVKEKERERDRKYLALPETKAKRCELSRKWRLKAGSPDKIRAWGLRWRTNNPEKIRARNERRRALKMNAKGIGIPFDEQAQLRRQKFRCYYCDCKLDKYHIDHIVPLSRGGTEYPDNKVLACPQCNLRKHDKMPHEWVDGGRLL